MMLSIPAKLNQHWFSGLGIKKRGTEYSFPSCSVKKALKHPAYIKLSVLEVSQSDYY